MEANMMELFDGKTTSDYPDDTVFVLEEKPVKRDPDTLAPIFYGDPRYDSLPEIKYHQS